MNIRPIMMPVPAGYVILLHAHLLHCGPPSLVESQPDGDVRGYVAARCEGSQKDTEPTNFPMGLAEYLQHLSLSMDEEESIIHQWLLDALIDERVQRLRGER